MRLRFLIAGMFVWVAGVSTAAFAGDDDSSEQIGLRQSYDTCSKNSDGITARILDCDGQEWKYQDRRLNKAYKTLLKKLSPNQRLALTKNERLWIKNRENTCTQPKDSGTMGDINYSSCFLDETAKQATKLESMLNGIKP